jgi:tRNA (guanosine-2'-O-)-methyltransferase
MFVSEERKQRIRQLVYRRQGNLVVVLEDIHYPHNAEAVLRSCDAFGVQDVHFIFQNQKPYNPRHVGKNTSASANKWLTFHIHHSTTECIDRLENNGYCILATIIGDEKSENIYSVDLSTDKIALVLGNERDGVTKEIIRRAHKKIHIPMAGMVQSLNLSVTASILLFEITRQRKASGTDIVLPEAKQDQLVNDYLDREKSRILRKPHKHNP